MASTRRNFPVLSSIERIPLAAPEDAPVGPHDLVTLTPVRLGPPAGAFEGEQLRIDPTPNTERPTLTERKWEILSLIAQRGPSSAKRLAEATALTEQAVSRHLSELFEERLIVPDPSRGLRRPRSWVLSARGTNLVWAIQSEP